MKTLRLLTFLLLVLATKSVSSYAYGKSNAVLLDDQEETWVSLGWGKFNENFYFGIESMYVEIFQNEQSPNTYRIRNPFTETVIGWSVLGWGESLSSNVSEYLYFRVLVEGDELFDRVITKEQEGLVYFYSDYTANSLNTGFTNTSYNDDVCLVFPGAFTALRDPSNWTHNCVLQYKDKENHIPGYIQLAPYYYMFNTGGWDQTQNNGVITIVMPDFILKDYSAAIEYTDKFTDADDVEYAVTNVTLGADVAYAKIGMYPGKASKDGLTYVMNNGQEINARGEYKIAFPEGAESGIYTVYVVPFDGEGDVEKYSSYDVFRYEAPGKTWTPMYVGTWEYSLTFGNDDGTPAYAYNLVLSVCDQDETKYKISNLWNGVDFIFTLNGDNTLSFEDQPTGVDFGYDSGEVWVSDLCYENWKGYIEEDGVFYFNIYYHDDEYNWGHGYETFTLTGKYEDASGIEDVAKDAEAINAPTYNLQGVAVGSDYKGIVIRNGKKFLRK